MLAKGRRQTGPTERPLREAEEKTELRRAARSARERIGAEDRAIWSERIRERLRSLPVWKESGLVALYAPIRGEADLLPLVEIARREGKRVVFPRACVEARTLKFYEVERAAELSPGAYGVPEPPRVEARSVRAASLDLIVLPGLAFDRRGRRLGFGGGYYDRLLAAPAPATVGVAFECQLRETLPEEPHDRGVDVVVTELRSLAPGPRGGGASRSGGEALRRK